jgi:hypothetical protein
MGHSSYNNFYGGKYLGAEFKFAWFPKTCELTGNLIWLKYAYSLIIIYTGASKPVIHSRWHDKNAHIMWLLKR